MDGTAKLLEDSEAASAVGIRPFLGFAVTRFTVAMTLAFGVKQVGDRLPHPGGTGIQGDALRDLRSRLSIVGLLAGLRLAGGDPCWTLPPNLSSVAAALSGRPCDESPEDDPPPHPVTTARAARIAIAYALRFIMATLRARTCLRVLAVPLECAIQTV